MEQTVEMETLAQLLQDDAVDTAQPTPTGEPTDVVTEETVVNTRDDDAPAEQGTAKDFSIALNKRMEKERQKMEAELADKYKSDLEFAQKMRQLRGDKDYQAILDDVFEEKVKTFAQDNNVPDGIARELLALKMQGMTKVSPAPVEQSQMPVQNSRLTTLAEQVEDIRQNDGVDMMEVLETDETLRARVGKGEWDINRAYAHYLSSERKRTPPVSKASPVSGAGISFSNVSKEQFDSIDARLARGETIKFT